jgi:hypothetical protein
MILRESLPEKSDVVALVLILDGARLLSVVYSSFWHELVTSETDFVT